MKENIFVDCKVGMEKKLFGELLDGGGYSVLVMVLVLSPLYSARHMAGCQSRLAK